MNELTVADKGAEWRRLKSLVLDSVSSPITRRVYNLGLDEFIARYGHEPRPAGFTKRPSLLAGWRSKRANSGRFDQRADNGGAEAGCRGGRQRTAGAGTGVGHRPDQGREVSRRPRRELAVSPSGASAPECAGRTNEKGPARPRHVREPARLRAAPV